MEESKNKIGKHTIKFGIMLGIVLILFDLILYVMDISMESKFKYLNIIISAGIITYGIYVFREKNNGGYIKYDQSLLIGFLISLYGGIILSIYTYVFLKFIDSSEITKMLDLMQQKMTDMQNVSEESIDKAMKIQRIFLRPAMISLFKLIGSAFSGLILSLLISIFMKKQDTSFEGTMKEV